MASKSMRGVIITVYEGSSAPRPNPAVETIMLPKFSRKSSIWARSDGYDRRSQLLAYARELRQSDINGPNWAEWSSKSKPREKEKCGWRRMKFRISFLRIFRGHKWKWKYERVGTENKSGRRSRKRASGRRKNKIWGKLKRLLKGLSFGWSRNHRKMSQF